MRTVAIALALSCAAALPGQAPDSDRFADSVRKSIEAAVDAGNRADLEQALQVADRALAAFPASEILLHYRAYGLYRAGTMALGARDLAASRKAFDVAREILEGLVKRQPIPETHALLASVYGMQIAVARVPMVSGMTLGPRSASWMEKAVAAGPENPRVWVMKGIGAFNTPSMFGGGADKAEADLKKALSLFTNDNPAPPLPAWGRADAHIWLGQVYAKMGKKDLARAQYDSALALQPRNGWITYSLIPALSERP
jgi:tetratricopeptide (TPR) repeat protein